MPYYVLDESSYRTDKNTFPSPDEAKDRAEEAARILGRPVTVYELLNQALHFAFRVHPDGRVCERDPLPQHQAIEPTAPAVLGRVVTAAAGQPKKLEVLRGNKKLGAWTRDKYQVDAVEPFEDGAKLTLSKLSGQATSARRLVLFVRYMKWLDKDEFNASKGDGVNKVAFRVLQRGPTVAASYRSRRELLDAIADVLEHSGRFDLAAAIDAEDEAVAKEGPELGLRQIVERLKEEEEPV